MSVCMTTLALWACIAASMRGVLHSPSTASGLAQRDSRSRTQSSLPQFAACVASSQPVIQTTCEVVKEVEKLLSWIMTLIPTDRSPIISSFSRTEVNSNKATDCLYFAREGCEVLRSVWLSVCLSVCSYNLKNYTSKLHEIFGMLLWPWLGPPLTTIQYVMYFRFCEWRHVFT